MARIDVGGMSTAWMERFIVGRVDGHVVDAHLAVEVPVIDYTGRETAANEVDKRRISLGISHKLTVQPRLSRVGESVIR